MKVTKLGIRHHGPGSARSVAAALDLLKPDLVLVEMPEDAQSAIPFLTEEGLKPPVALLLYAPENSTKASFYPFAKFSPEWITFQWCLKHGVFYRCFDLPRGITFTLEDTPAESEAAAPPAFRGDPLNLIAELEGYTDGERWWEARFETSEGPTETFTAVAELMGALRSEMGREEDRETQLREAWMREHIRMAQKEGYKNIVVVCGAWHVPALDETQNVKEDKALLKGLKKTKVLATWVPWTYERLSMQSGYAAGVVSPAWYEMLFDNKENTKTISRWMVKAARVLRKEGVEVSSAHAIEAVRLSGALATLREMPMPGIHELMESVQSVYCNGHAEPLALVQKQVVTGVKMGAVPASALSTPLLEDLAREQKRLKLKPNPEKEELQLDLRKESHLDRSKLLHRLRLIGANWGTERTVRNQQGTFHEDWHLKWDPDYSISLVEAGVFGNTIAEAAGNKVLYTAREMKALPELTRLLQHLLKADLPQATQGLVTRLQDMAALSTDISILIQTLPALAETLRYGNVRNTDESALMAIISQMVPRICIHLPGLCLNLTEDAEREMWGDIHSTDAALRLLNDAEKSAEWKAALAKIIRMPGGSPLILGGTVRLLLDQQELQLDDAHLLLEQSLSPGMDAGHSARWIEGFAGSSALLLMHNPALFGLITEWAGGLQQETFFSSLPLLRRAFSGFSHPERAQLLGRVGHTPHTAGNTTAATADLHPQRAAAMGKALDDMLLILFTSPLDGKS